MSPSSRIGQVQISRLPRSRGLAATGYAWHQVSVVAGSLAIVRGGTRTGHGANMRWILFGLCLLAIGLASGCSGSSDAKKTDQPKFQVADDGKPGTRDVSPTTPATKPDGTGSANPDMANSRGMPSQPPSIPGEQLDKTSTITVPDGTPEELIAFIEDLQKQFNALGQNQPPAGSENIVFGKLRGICEAEQQAADKILAAKPDVAIRRKAVDARLHAMRFLSLVAPQESQLEDIRRFAQVLAVDDDPEISLQGRVILLGMRIGDVRANRDKDIQGLVNDLKALLANKSREQSVLDVTQQAEMTLRMMGHEKEADDAFRAIAEAFKDHANPAIAKEAANMFKQLELRKFGLDEKLDAVARKEKGAAQPFMAAMQQAMNQGEPTELILSKAENAVSMLEQTGQYALGLQLCQMIQAIFQKSSNEQLKVAAAHAVDMATRRLQIVGKPFTVDGVALDGAQFDFTKYKGKVVLVDFWATWCGPCVEELPNVRDNYEKYHDKGFDVIGVNLDQDRGAAKQFLQSEKLPWVTIINDELVQKCGIEAIPFIVLLDRNGTAVALHVRGPQLGQKLAEMLGPPAKEPAVAPTPPTPPQSSSGLPASGKQSFIPARSSARIAESLAAAGYAADAEDETVPSEQRRPPESTLATEPPDVTDSALPEIDETRNPYLAPAGLSSMQLIEFLLDMQEKPKSIQARPGFAEAIADAADRILASTTEARYRSVAALAELSIWHSRACLDDAKAEQHLRVAISQLRDEKQPAVKRRIAFLQLEQRALDSDKLPVEQIPSLLGELKTFFDAQDALTATHLRLASLTVHAINRLDDAQQRDKYFAEFGKMFALSSDQRLAPYGKRLVGSGAAASDLVGQPLQLEGETAMGTPLDWASYRGKFVVVDFWATWCGPCRREMPHLKSLVERHRNGMNVVAISLDADLRALADYLADQKIDWENVVGKTAQDLATQCGVRGIPTMLLVDPEGKVLKIAHRVEELEPLLDQRLAKH